MQRICKNPSILVSMTHKALEMVAELMALSARTAPKGKGQDSILIRVVAGEQLQELSRELEKEYLL